VGTLKGPTGMGMTGVMQAQDAGTAANDYVFTMTSAPEDMRAKLINGDVDVAALPTNMASVLYNKADQSVSILAVNTLGVLYILDSEQSVSTIEDLRGTTLYATGQGATPEYVLRHILTQNGLEPGTDLELIFKSEHDELASLMIADEVTLGMLPEPYVTTTTSQKEGLSVVLDITQEWEKVSDGMSLAMGCIVVRNDFLEDNRDAVNAFLEEYRQSVEFVNSRPEEAAALMEEYDIVKQQVALKAIPNCNIVYIDGDEMKASVESLLQVLFEANPQSVGGSLPDDAFYYKR